MKWVSSRMSPGIATFPGCPVSALKSWCSFPGGLLGIAFNVDEDEIGVSCSGNLRISMRATRWSERASHGRRGGRWPAWTGDRPAGHPLTGKGPIDSTTNAFPLSARPHPSWTARRSPSPCKLDSRLSMRSFPVGLGQRELILGDRQTGKTAIAVDAILNQRGRNVVCVYCAIGQRASAVAKVVANLQEKGAMEYTVVVVVEGNDAPGLVYITPYAATTIAEYFMEIGPRCAHRLRRPDPPCRAYRELSLLLRRPPGREAFPGDIFYIHSRMLGTGHSSE
jgi:F-type H+-transporting ATPase subunit alpha